MEQNMKRSLGSSKQANEYEESKRLKMAENQKIFQSLGLPCAAMSLDTKKRKKKQLFDSMSDSDGEQPNEETDTRVKVSKKKQNRTFIPPRAITRYANLAKQRVVANALSSKSKMNKGKVSDTTRGINNSVQDCEDGHNINSQLDDRIPEKQTTSSGIVTKNTNAVENRDENEHSKDIASLEDVRDDEMEARENNYENDLHETNHYEEYEDQLTLCEEDENVDVGQEDHEVSETHNETVGKVKKVRGPTRMSAIWTQESGVRIRIEVNELGQPINENTSKLTHFMGAVSRSGKYCPTNKPWHKVSAKKKDSLLKLLKTKFDIPQSAETWILQSFGRKVKNWRARVNKDYYDPSLSLREQIKSRPKQVQKKQWKRLVKYWNNPKFKRLSEKNKANRSQKKMIQVTGKKSYARVRADLKTSLGNSPTRMDMFRKCFSKEGATKNVAAETALEQMQELSSTLPDGEIDKPGPEDVYSRVMGNHKYGAAEMYGLGVRASDVFGVIPSRSACRKENFQLKTKNAELSAINEQLTAQLAEKIGASDGSCVQALATPECPVVPNVARNLKVGVEVFLYSITNPSEKVARGWLRSLDPTEKLGGIEIGKDWCEVNVQVAMKNEEYLLRPNYLNDLFVTVADVVGASTAWPCRFVSVVRED